MQQSPRYQKSDDSSVTIEASQESIRSCVQYHTSFQKFHMLEGNHYCFHNIRRKKQTVHGKLCTFLSLFFFFLIKAFAQALSLFENGACLLTAVICCARLRTWEQLPLVSGHRRNALICSQNCKGLSGLQASVACLQQVEYAFWLASLQGRKELLARHKSS